MSSVTSDEDSAGPPKRQFTLKCTTALNSFFNSGMKGVGKQYEHLIARAAAETGLSSEQVKV